MICICGRQLRFTPATVTEPLVTPDVYAVMVNCACGSSRSAIIWQTEEFALDVPAVEEDDDGYLVAAE